MGLLYERKETADEIIIVHKGYALVFIFLALWIICVNFIEINLLAYIFLALFVLSMMGILKPYLEITKAMKKGGVLFSGSKFSFRNPLKAIIKKQQVP